MCENCVCKNQFSLSEEKSAICSGCKSTSYNILHLIRASQLANSPGGTKQLEFLYCFNCDSNTVSSDTNFCSICKRKAFNVEAPSHDLAD